MTSPADAAARELKRAKAGDREAAGRVLEAHRGMIVRWCNEMVEPGLELDDMIQEAFLAGLDAIRWFKPERGYVFLTYLKRCVRNRLATWRKDRRQRPLALDADESDSMEGLAVVPPDNLVLLPMLRNLSKRDRRVIELRFGLTGGGELGVESVRRRLGRSAADIKRIEAEALKDLRYLAGPGHDPAS